MKKKATSCESTKRVDNKRIQQTNKKRLNNPGNIKQTARSLAFATAYTDHCIILESCVSPQGNIRVFCRVRSMLPSEEREGERLSRIWFPDEKTVELVKPDTEGRAPLVCSSAVFGIHNCYCGQSTSEY